MIDLKPSLLLSIQNELISRTSLNKLGTKMWQLGKVSQLIVVPKPCLGSRLALREPNTKQVFGTTRCKRCLCLSVILKGDMQLRWACGTPQAHGFKNLSLEFTLSRTEVAILTTQSERTSHTKTSVLASVPAYQALSGLFCTLCHLSRLLFHHETYHCT